MAAQSIVQNGKGTINLKYDVLLISLAPGLNIPIRFSEQKINFGGQLL